MSVRLPVGRLLAQLPPTAPCLPPSCPQIFILSLFIFGLSLVGVFYPYNRGALFSALIFLYALTACIAGYVATSYYRQFEGDQFVHSILLTVSVYCGPFFGMFMFLNTVAIVYRVTRAAPRLLASWAACRPLLAVVEPELCLGLGSSTKTRFGWQPTRAPTPLLASYRAPLSPRRRCLLAPSSSSSSSGAW